MNVDIVIKSYPPDFPWLHFALRSIHKFASGFRRILVIAPPGHGLNLTAESIVEVPGPESYKYQQVCKLNVDHHTDADAYLHVDSDMIFTRPVTPETFMRDGKLRWFIKPFKDCAIEEKKAWMHVMTKCLMECPPYEMMRKCTILAPRWAYAGFREFIQKTHGCTMDAYVMNQPGNEFSEYNCLGFYLWLYHRDKFYWHDESVEPMPEPWERQFWSYGGLTNEIRNQMNMILA